MFGRVGPCQAQTHQGAEKAKGRFHAEWPRSRMAAPNGLELRQSL